MKIGLISDTHDYFDPRIEKIFEGVDHILHAGDIGSDLIIAQLREIAPVTAVLGNNDSSPFYRLTETAVFSGRKFLVHHIVAPFGLGDEAREQIENHKPHIVVFGHSHKPFEQTIGGILFLNPGYAGKPRFNQSRSVAIFDCDEHTTSTQFINL